MQYTNKHNLPKELCDALTKNRYSGNKDAELANHISVTSLIAPIQQTILKRRYPNCNTIDVIDNLWSMFGSIAHTLLEEHGSDEALVEERFYTTIDGITISGGMDHIKNEQITDYKVTSVWKVKKESYTEWEQQLNCYAWLLKKNGQEVKSIRIIVIMRDWTEPAAYEKDYPEAPIKIIPIKIKPIITN